MRRGSSSGGSSKSTGRTLECAAGWRAAGRIRRTARRSRQPRRPVVRRLPRVSGFATLRGPAVRDHDDGRTALPPRRDHRCRAGTSPTSGKSSPSRSPTPRRRCTARPRAHVGRVRPPGQRRGRHPPRPGRHRAGQGRPVPLQRHRVHRVDVRRVQGRARPHQHQLPLPGRRARLPVGQRRLRRRRLPRHLHRHHRAHPRPGPPGGDLAVGRRRRRAVPRLGRSPTRRPPTATPSGSVAAVGPRRRPADDDLHRRHHRHAQGRDVAPGRPVPHPRRPDEPAVQERRGRPRPGARAGQGRRARSACPPARSCTAPASTPSSSSSRWAAARSR